MSKFGLVSKKSLKSATVEMPLSRASTIPGASALKSATPTNSTNSAASSRSNISKLALPPPTIPIEN
eukprot:CAMPEP_0178999398 /NCGR_PEP_ID=MMETSP0795-20121207/10038_1 /TAXON_ID=88552 /ORGANISM="Amoebophrya sp., Strain Ameob2" /LENGTH=66 /DNA_ID=CAMNT_0020692167 /DNA_START=8 /DNA_END=205 /DNA_ORIENTATION=+